MRTVDTKHRDVLDIDSELFTWILINMCDVLPDFAKELDIVSFEQNGPESYAFFESDHAQWEGTPLDQDWKILRNSVIEALHYGNYSEMILYRKVD